jgi:polysaccharide biosynthesis/export protein
VDELREQASVRLTIEIEFSPPSSTNMFRVGYFSSAAMTAVLVSAAAVVSAQEAPTPAPKASNGLVLPADYVIGADDVLAILVWREKDLSMDVVVRPDGHLTLPLVSDVQAAGLTPEKLRDRLQERLKEFIKDPNVTVMVRQVNSRKVFITGHVVKPGAYPLLTPLRVVDLIALAGGLQATADARHIVVLRTERDGRVALPIDFEKVSRGLLLWQDVALRPGDAIVVP